jgi:hypothetical protein
MAPRLPKTPPRPLAPGDVVVTFHHRLGEWTAAQISHLDMDDQLAAVLDLDWSSPTKPESLANLGQLRPLTRHIGNWRGEQSHCYFPWVLPRSFTVLGSLAPLVTTRSPSYGSGWSVGDALRWERLAAHQDIDWNTWTEPDHVSIKGPTLQVPADIDTTTIRELYIRGVTHLDAENLAKTFPKLTTLNLFGDLSEMENAVALNRLTGLRKLLLVGYFGMTAADCLTPGGTPDLEDVVMHNVPHEYATAMRRVWRPEAANGTYSYVTGARKPEWVAENKDNPLRDWDNREGVSKSAYKKSIGQFKMTRRQVLAALDEPQTSRLESLRKVGAEYGTAFNAIGLAARDEFIMTEEREELYEALDGVLKAVTAERGMDLTAEREALLDGLDGTRDW